MKCLYSIILLLCSLPAMTEAAQLRQLQVSDQSGFTQIEIVLDAEVRYKTLLLDNPPRVVIDLVDTINPHAKFPVQSERVKRIRHAVRDETNHRLVFDLFQLEKYEHYYGDGDTEEARLFVILGTKPLTAGKVKHADKGKPAAQKPRDVIVMIDPGHGGKDPGAVAQFGTKDKKQKIREKSITLAVSMALKRELERTPGIKVLLTRNKDKFVALRKRIKIAHERKADLFLSLHADALEQAQVSGASVYILSENAATSEIARWLADDHDQRQSVAGVDIKDKNKDVVSIIADLSQTATLQDSVNFARILLQALNSEVKVRTKDIEAADFAVLKSLDIPSALVELGYLSNPAEVEKLRAKSYQRSLAQLLAKGIVRYLRKHPVADTAFDH